tara:strand:+ start:1810 stop:1989 length:180 start_codon:yes stop_codon:yes gene_type:complete
VEVGDLVAWSDYREVQYVPDISHYTGIIINITIGFASVYVLASGLTHIVEIGKLEKLNE